jgi:hypothetical protein
MHQRFFFLVTYPSKYRPGHNPNLQAENRTSLGNYYFDGAESSRTEMPLISSFVLPKELGLAFLQEMLDRMSYSAWIAFKAIENETVKHVKSYVSG